MENITKLRIILLSILVILIIGVMVLYILAVSAYKGSFDRRIITAIHDRFHISYFPNMINERHTFQSNNGQTLVGYLYRDRDETVSKKGVVVFSHGFGGGGQIGYMNIYDVLTKNGYYVLAYDATANDESEGEAVGGLPQGYIDLDYAISYAQTIEEIKSLPFVLMGYSWGGFSVTNVLNYHPEVKAVVSFSGFNKSMDLIEYEGQKKVGNIAKVLLPLAKIYEFFEYGKYAFSSSISGFKKSDCAVMIVHSEDDTIVPIEYGYDLYYKKYKNNERFVFKKYTDRGHAIFQNQSHTLDAELLNDVVTFFDKNVQLSAD